MAVVLRDHLQLMADVRPGVDGEAARWALAEIERLTLPEECSKEMLRAACVGFGLQPDVIAAIWRNLLLGAREQERQRRELKPCPFCGGAAKFRQSDMDRVRVAVSCESLACGAGVPFHPDVDSAAATWNRRKA